MTVRALRVGAAVWLLAAFLGSGCGPKTAQQSPPTVAGDHRDDRAAKPAPKPLKAQKVVGLAGKRILMVLAPKDFRDEEYQYPYNAFVGGGASVTIASTKPGKLRGVGGTEVEATEAASAADPGRFDAVVFVGGPGMVAYLDDAGFVGLAGKARSANRLIGAICVAPAILANAGLLKGVPATAFPDQLELLKASGAQVAGKHVVVAGDTITADGPDAADEFAQALAEALGKPAK